MSEFVFLWMFICFHSCVLNMEFLEYLYTLFSYHFHINIIWLFEEIAKSMFYSFTVIGSLTVIQYLIADMLNK